MLTTLVVMNVLTYSFYRMEARDIGTKFTNHNNDVMFDLQLQLEASKIPPIYRFYIEDEDFLKNFLANKFQRIF